MGDSSRPRELPEPVIGLAESLSITERAGELAQGVDLVPEGESGAGVIVGVDGVQAEVQHTIGQGWSVGAWARYGWDKTKAAGAWLRGSWGQR